MWISQRLDLGFCKFASQFLPVAAGASAGTGAPAAGGGACPPWIADLMYAKSSVLNLPKRSLQINKFVLFRVNLLAAKLIDSINTLRRQRRSSWHPNRLYWLKMNNISISVNSWDEFEI